MSAGGSAGAALDQRALPSSRIELLAFSAIMTVGAWVWPRGMRGITEASV
jgi:hypothetical protein